MEAFQPIIQELQEKEKATADTKLKKWLSHSIQLLTELQERDLPPSAFHECFKVLRRQLDGDTRYEQIRSFYTMLTDVARKKFNLTTPNFYQTQWIGIGMTAFGIPFGLIFSFALDNFAFIGIGIPFGLSIGLALGAGKDKKAKEEGTQLSVQTR